MTDEVHHRGAPRRDVYATMAGPAGGAGEQRVGGLYAVNPDGSSDILATANDRNADFPDPSYGGYAVMMGLARDPERYRCGVNYLGVTGIMLMFDVIWSDMSDTDFLRYNAKELIGDPERDAAQFRATSPLANAAKVRAPVLMAYGGADRRVPVVPRRAPEAVARRHVSGCVPNASCGGS